MARSRSAHTLRRQVGQLLIAGLEGPQLTSLERAWWKLVQPAGAILFRRNIETASQTFALLAATAELSEAPLLRCVDVEGGLVDRLRDAVAPMPSAAEVASTGKAALFRKHGALIAREVRMLGFNATLAPVLDLALPVSTAVMRTRVVSPDQAQVVRYAAAFLDGLASARVLGCGKHFPGLGGGSVDSHNATPRIARTWDELWAEDIAPYRTLASRLPMVMVSHAAYPLADRQALPASVSKHWITGVLRRRIGFAGLVLSDDMEMGGILSQSSIEDAAVASVAAGVDLLEICKNASLVLRAYEALLVEAERSPAFRRRVTFASRKVRAFLRARLATPAHTPPSEMQISKLRDAIRTFADEVKSAAPGARS